VREEEKMSKWCREYGKKSEGEGGQKCRCGNDEE
jgi:hypothetical protein